MTTHDLTLEEFDALARSDRWRIVTAAIRAGRISPADEALDLIFWSGSAWFCADVGILQPALGVLFVAWMVAIPLWSQHPVDAVVVALGGVVGAAVILALHRWAHRRARRRALARVLGVGELAP